MHQAIFENLPLAGDSGLEKFGLVFEIFLQAPSLLYALCIQHVHFWAVELKFVVSLLCMPSLVVLSLLIWEQLADIFESSTEVLFPNFCGGVYFA